MIGAIDSIVGVGGGGACCGDGEDHQSPFVSVPTVKRSAVKVKVKVTFLPCNVTIVLMTENRWWNVLLRVRSDNNVERSRNRDIFNV